jgi:adenosylmethionine-8-amino-7-oxononanoate aminotransferase
MTTNRAIGWGMEALPRIIRGEGSYLYDADGRRYLDGSGGPAAFSIGHANREVNAAIVRQLEKVACGYRYLFTSEALEELTRLLLARCGPKFAHIVFSLSGSEAVESAMKVALQYWDARALPTKKRFIARERSYHGNTLGALSVSGYLQRRRPFVGSLLDASFVSAANAYRPLDGLAGAALARALADELEARILALGPEQVAAFIFEPVVGAAGGVVPAPTGYAQSLRAVCDRYQVLMIADEVMCGAGRCGTWCALEHDAVIPDITAVGKGLAAGYIPLAATIVQAKLGEVILAEHGSILTGHTYSGHTAACAAGLAVQRIIERESLVQHVRTRGERLLSDLCQALERFEEVGDVRGRGYLIGVELVRNRDTKEPFSAEYALSHRIGRAAFQNGLICYPCAGNVDGVRGDTILVAPPYNATEAELSELIDKLSAAVEDTLAVLGRPRPTTA